MLRSAFLKRMALAAAATAFLDVPWPKAKPAPADGSLAWLANFDSRGYHMLSIDTLGLAPGDYSVVVSVDEPWQASRTVYAFSVDDEPARFRKHFVPLRTIDPNTGHPITLRPRAELIRA